MMKFTVFQDAKKEWRWNLKSRNGKIIACSGEGYKRKSSAHKMIVSIIQNIQRLKPL